MKDEKEIRALLEKLEKQRAELGETATIEENAPVAMTQLELEARIKLLKFILK